MAAVHTFSAAISLNNTQDVLLRLVDKLVGNCLSAVEFGHVPLPTSSQQTSDASLSVLSTRSYQHFRIRLMSFVRLATHAGFRCTSLRHMATRTLLVLQCLLPVPCPQLCQQHSPSTTCSKTNAVGELCALVGAWDGCRVVRRACGFVDEAWAGRVA